MSQVMRCDVCSEVTSGKRYEKGWFIVQRVEGYRAGDGKEAFFGGGGDSLDLTAWAVCSVRCLAVLVELSQTQVDV